ncbi:MAG: MlaD family protein [Treponema sp.]|jgi:phospholipid/cholesterol/gamma-HCH transport system substrate-binding protein|nr:MlaD family protein [Treponema sp.]
MKFKIRFADQIVGFFIIVALASIVFVVFALGKSQRWFAKDENFRTQFDSATGLNKNMPVQFKGFVIGNVQSFVLNEDNKVDVVFTIHEAYLDRIKRGSTVELVVSPIGLGNQFVFHTGRGKDLHEGGTFIPAAGTPQAQSLFLEGLADEPAQDSIADILGKVNSLLSTLDEALKGTDGTALGQIVGGANRLVSELPDTLEKTAETVTNAINDITSLLEGLKPVIANVNSLTEQLADPNGTVGGILGGSGPVYESLLDSLNSITGILRNVDEAVAFLPGQLPQVAGLLVDLRVTLKTAEDVLTGLTNNPLIKKGIPERVDAKSSGTSPGDIRF